MCRAIEQGTIDVNHTLVFYSKGEKEGCTYAINTPKTESGRRIVPMLPIVKKAFLHEKQIQQDFEIRCTVVIDNYTDFIFLNRHGSVQNQGTLNKALRRIVRDCNYDVLDKHSSEEEPVLLPNISNHILRHTFATRMCEAGINVKAMQDILGHADAETTMNIYADATRELKCSEMNSLDSYFHHLYNAV